MSQLWSDGREMSEKTVEEIRTEIESQKVYFEGLMCQYKSGCYQDLCEVLEDLLDFIDGKDSK